MTPSRAMLMIAAGLVVALSACASTGSSSGPSRSRNLITLEELEGEERGTAHDVVSRLRPRWLQSRGAGSVTSATRDVPRVYVDGQLYGEVDALRQIDLREIQEIRYMNAGDATTRFGTNHRAGAILVTTRRG